jgi:hypothetical protein
MIIEKSPRRRFLKEMAGLGIAVALHGVIKGSGVVAEESSTPPVAEQREKNY